MKEKMHKNLSSLNSQFSTLNSQKGQVLLIVVLIMVVGITVGLSVASRSLTNLRNTTEEANSQRAFSAAEAGIEQAIHSGKVGTLIGGSAGGIQALDPANPNIAAIKQVTVTEIKGQQIILKGGSAVGQDDGTDLWISSYSNNPAQLVPNSNPINVVVYWCERTDTTCTNAAMEIIVVSGSRAQPITKRYAFDPIDSRRGTNNFAPTVSVGSSEQIAGKNFRYKTSPIAFTDGMFVRIIPLYADAKTAVWSSVPLPVQGRLIDSTGISGDTVRKVTYFQGLPEFPAEFFYILFQTKPV